MRKFTSEMDVKAKNKVENVPEVKKEVDKKKKSGLFSFFTKKEKPVNKDMPLDFLDDEPTATQSKKVEIPLAEPSSKKLMTDKESSSTYGASSKTQFVFLFAEVSKWATIQKRYNSLDGITCLGTTDVDMISEEYNKKNLASSIILFVLNQNEVEPIYDFLTGINISDLSADLLKVYIVRDEKVNVDIIKRIKGIGKFAKLSKVSKAEITTDILDKVVLEVIKKQPVYEESSEAVAPSKAVVIEKTGNFQVDMDRLQNMLAKSREGNTDAALKESIKRRIVSNKDFSSHLTNVEKDIPSVALLKDVEADINRQIEKLRFKANGKDEIVKLISDKLIISSMATKELKDYIDQLVKDATNELNNKQIEISSIDPDILEKLEKAKMDSESLLIKRNEFKNQVSDAYHKYLALSELVINCIRVEDMKCLEVDKEMKTLVAEKTVPDALQGTVGTYVYRIREMREELSVIGEETKNNLVKAFNMSNTLLKNSHTLFKIDDLCIDMLLKQIEGLEQNQNVIAKVDTRLKERATLIYDFNGCGARSILSLIADENDLIVSMSDKGNFLNIGSKTMGAEEFINTNPDLFGNTQEVTEIQLDISNDVDGTIINVLDYIAKYFRSIYFVMEPTSSNSSFEIEVLRSISKVVYWACPIESLMIEINRINSKVIAYPNVSIRKIVFNKFIKDEHGDNIDKLRTLSNIGSSVSEIRIPFLKSLSTNESPSKANLEGLMKIKSII